MNGIAVPVSPVSRKWSVKAILLIGVTLALASVWFFGRPQEAVMPVTASMLVTVTPTDLPIRIPDFNRLEWPVRVLESPRPPCIMVKGTARAELLEKALRAYRSTPSDRLDY